MPSERTVDAEPRNLLDLLRGQIGGGAGGGAGGGGSITPPAQSPTDPVSQYPGLVYRSGFWYDPANDQWYDSRYNKLPGNPTISQPGPITNQPRRPPSDGPIVPEAQPRAEVRPGPVATPGTPEWYAGQGIPTAPTNYLPGAGGMGDLPAYQLANPMPSMPEMGTASVSPHQAWSLNQGSSGGTASAFKPWGNSVGAQMSQILRYGGRPGIQERGGFEGTEGGEGPAPSPINRPSVTLPDLLGQLGGMIPDSGRSPTQAPSLGGTIGWRPPRNPPPVSREREKQNVVPSTERRAIGNTGTQREQLSPEQLEYLLRMQSQLLRA